MKVILLRVYLTVFFGITTAVLQCSTAVAVSGPSVTTSSYSPPISGTELDKYTSYPKRRLVIETKQGRIECQLFEKLAPKHVAHFSALASSHFFDSTTFHRIMPGYMIQGGDPNSKDDDLSNDGYGQPGMETVPAEFSSLHHDRGIISTARKPDDENSATSQFFIMVDDRHSFDKHYTIWGQVMDGMDVVDKIVHLPKVQGDNPGKASQILRMYVQD